MARRATTNKHDRRKTQKKRQTKVRDDKPETAFPASPRTPGQGESRNWFEHFNADSAKYSWWNDYLLLRDEGFSWRVAAYIAWAAAPAKTRWPATQKELADVVLGLKTDQVIRRWKNLNPQIDKRVERFKVEPLLRHRRDVIDALVDVAASRDTSAHSDRKLFLEMTGDYRPRQAMELSGADGGPVQTLNAGDLSGLDDGELERLIHNLQAIAGDAGDRADAPSGPERAGTRPAPTGWAAPAGVDGAPAGDADARAAV